MQRFVSAGSSKSSGDANDPQPETAAKRKRKSRLLGERRALASRAGGPVAAFALLLGVLTHYDQLRYRMDHSHDAMPVAERYEPGFATAD